MRNGLIGFLLATVVLGGAGYWYLVVRPARERAVLMQIQQQLAASQAARPPQRVLYQIDGDRGTMASITYSGAGGKIEQLDAPLPWKKLVDIGPNGAATISAQTKSGSDSAVITCKITNNGDVLQEARSVGAYKIATCSSLIR